MNTRPPRWRQRLLINPKLQITFLVYTLFVGLVVSMGSYVIYSRTVLPTEPVLTTASYVTLIIAMLLGYAMLFGVGLILSNRVFGPLYRLSNHMEAIARGEEPPELKFRDSDYYQELATSYNLLLESIKKNRK